MAKIWDERNEWQTMLDVEIAACEANAELGRIPKEAVEVIKAKADFDVERIHEIDREINHDIIAFLSAVGEYVGDEAKYIHMGMTSTDVKDTALNVQIKQASDVLIADLEKLAEVLKRRAVEFKYTPTIGPWRPCRADYVRVENSPVVQRNFKKYRTNETGRFRNGGGEIVRRCRYLCGY